MIFHLLKTQWPLALGAALGAALGYYGQCQSGTCVFTATWWGGSIMGALLAALVTSAARTDQ
jgi:hypothetical protein